MTKSWWGRRAPYGVLGGIALLSLGLVPGEASAELPMPPQVGCGSDGIVADCPSELVGSGGVPTGGSWSYVSFIADVYDKVQQSQRALGSGSHTDLAWQTTAGRFDVPIAILDSGIRWRSRDLANKIWLNEGELPAPRDASGALCPSRDCDGNGLFTVSDYANDSRVSITAGVAESDDILDGSDLIAVFSDGVDGDGNGYIDDIGGWDFFWDDNDPYTSTDFYHGTSVLEEAAAEGNNGGDIGHCPNCAVIPVRISDSFVGEGNRIGAGIIYAVDRGAKVIGMALGSLSNTPLLIQAMQYAWANDVTIVAAAGDELGYHHNMPGANEHALYVHSIKYWPTIERENAQTFLGFFGCNNFGARLDVVAPSGACATGSVAATSGMAGLVYSRAKDLGIDLSASEARQIIIQGVDDIDIANSSLDKSPMFPSSQGWDMFFGYGRTNSARMLSLVTPGTIPPEVEINAPVWFDYIDPRVQPTLDIVGRVDAPRSGSYRYEVEWAPGAEPTEVQFTRFAIQANQSAPIDGVLATLNFADIPPEALNPAAPTEKADFGDTFQEKLDKVNAQALTLRVRVTDEAGNTAEMRKQVFLVEDPDLLDGFPVKLDRSGDSSPVLYDLNADGILEIVMATSDGAVHAFTGDGTELPGWPVWLNAFGASANHQGAPAYNSGIVSGDARQGVLSSVAVGDLEGDGQAEVFIASLDGFLYAFESDGSLRSGFPVTRDPVEDADTNPDVWFDPGMFSNPVLFDLDGDGYLEIIQTAMDRKVYVFREDGSRQPGFPVDLTSAEYPDTDSGRIVSSPAVGDLDGDGLPEIVVGTNEYLNETTWWGLAYAIRGDGELNPRGALVPGWPIEVVGAMNGLIMYIGEGVSPSPALYDIDGDGLDEVILSGVAGIPVIYWGNGRPIRRLNRSRMGTGSGADADTGFFTIVSNPAIGDIDGDGRADVSMVGSGLDYFIALGLSVKLDYAHLLGAWDVSTGKMLDAFPAFLEDISFFHTPSIADITGDGLPEVIAGTSGYILHAVDATGNEPPGWPKQTGGWMIASPTVGDITGDGFNEVIAVTREGFLFAWSTQGSSEVEPEWGSYRHDPQNTGNYGSEVDRGLGQSAPRRVITPTKAPPSRR